LEYHAQLLAPPVLERYWSSGVSSAEGHWPGGELKHLHCEGKVSELGLFTLEKRLLWRGPPSPVLFLQGGQAD